MPQDKCPHASTEKCRPVTVTTSAIQIGGSTMGFDDEESMPRPELNSPDTEQKETR